MHSATAERLEFAPPPPKGSLRALALALFVHLLLIAALTWGVNWKHSEQAASFEAELWSGTVQHPTPEPVTPPPPDAAPLAPAPEPQPLPAPVPPPVKAPDVKAAPVRPDADIALEKEKERQQAKKLQEKQQAELQAKLQAQQDKEREKKKEQALKNQQALAQHKAAEKAEQAEKAAEQKRQAKALEKEKLAAAAAAEARHQEAVKRMLGMAGTAAGAGAGASKGPSAGYASKVVARILPNVVFTDEITGSPQAEVEVRSTADGTIMSQRLVKSSGNKAWDDAVIKAIVRTGSLPRDTDGRVPSPMIIQFRPH